MESKITFLIKKLVPRSVRTMIIKCLKAVFPYKAHSFLMRRAWLNRKSTKEENHLDTYWGSSANSQRRKLVDLIVNELSENDDHHLSVLEYGSHVGVNIKLIKEAIGSAKNVTFYAVEPNNEAYISMSEKLPFVIGLNGEDEKFIQAKNFPDCNINLSFVNAVFYSMEGARVERVCSKLSSISDVIIIGDEMVNYEGEKTIIHTGTDYLGNEYITFAHPYKKILSSLGFSNLSLVTEIEPKLAITGYILAKK